jgi:molybdate transport system substrate-binding protein
MERKMSKARILTIIAALIVVVGLVLIALNPMRGRDQGVLVLCGGSMRAALEEAIEQYAAEPTESIDTTYAGSGELCAQIQNTGKGDIYICHDPFMPWAAEQGLIEDWRTVGYLDVVIVVPAGNPKGIGGLEDLADPGLRIGIGDQRYSTSGVIANSLLSGVEYGDAIRQNIRLETKGHQQRCTDVALGTLDAAIVWAAVAHLFADELTAIPIPRDMIDAVTSATYGRSDLQNVQVTVGLTRAGAANAAARRFYQYLVTDGVRIFEEYGFRPAGG